jgi:endopeptidase La
MEQKYIVKKEIYSKPPAQFISDKKNNKKRKTKEYSKSYDSSNDDSSSEEECKKRNKTKKTNKKLRISTQQNKNVKKSKKNKHSSEELFDTDDSEYDETDNKSESEEVSEEVSEEEQEDQGIMPINGRFFYVLKGNTKKVPPKEQKLIDEFNNLYGQTNSKNGVEYFKELNIDKKKEYIKKMRDIKNIGNENENENENKEESIDTKHNLIKIIECETTNNNKSIILSKLNNFENLGDNSVKMTTWINKIMNIPFGKYVKPPVKKTDGSDKIKEYLDKIKKNLDKDIYGHDDTKRQLIKIIAHTIANPSEGGNIFALQGPPGVGKTALIQDGVSKALGRPFAFISLGGATDSCFLEGHDYTYEGSNNGRIVELLQQKGCMNPIIYFDELDKVSDTPKGEEIINVLMHLTDQTQNAHFNDKYFGSIDFDLSKAIIIFSFNDEQKISRILRDRMKIVNVKGYKLNEKIVIARDFLIQKLIKCIGLDIQVVFSDEILEYIIDTYTNEGGVRKLKEILNDILLEINLRVMEGGKILGKKIKNKCIITKEMCEEDFLKTKHKMEHIQINSHPSVGQVNGLWANDYGIGGLVPIECSWIPSTDKLKLKLTGMQGKVMQESMAVAKTIAWKILPDTVKEQLNVKWMKSFDYGIHVHCPDGSTPKDGPSAGGAITTCLISLLTNIPVNNLIAMTGEINLKGQLTKIGGLEEKIFGAKKAGAKKVLCPNENSQDLNEIKNKFPNLFNDDFVVKTVNNIWEILDEVLDKKLKYNRF